MSITGAYHTNRGKQYFVLFRLDDFQSDFQKVKLLRSYNLTLLI